MHRKQLDSHKNRAVPQTEHLLSDQSAIRSRTLLSPLNRYSLLRRWDGKLLETHINSGRHIFASKNSNLLFSFIRLPLIKGMTFMGIMGRAHIQLQHEISTHLSATVPERHSQPPASIYNPVFSLWLSSLRLDGHLLPPLTPSPLHHPDIKSERKSPNSPSQKPVAEKMFHHILWDVRENPNKAQYVKKLSTGLSLETLNEFATTPALPSLKIFGSSETRNTALAYPPVTSAGSLVYDYSFSASLLRTSDPTPAHRSTGERCQYCSCVSPNSKV
ncbi:hypothetical protein Ac2012v2_006474 [Leucoagaricus gongylophorus]